MTLGQFFEPLRQVFVIALGVMLGFLGMEILMDFGPSGDDEEGG